ncbi:MAG: hypothetical protein JW715_12560 [Sedimentisphaerales bacterium]|nr:hypothetical protein [Sedimentisphaerales bacterium]
MAATTNTSGDERALNIAYIILITILTILAIGGSTLIHRPEYLAGTRNDPQYIVTIFGFSLILFPILALVAASASIVALISLSLRHGNFVRILLKLTMIVLGPAIVCCAFLYTTPLSPVFLEGLEQWVLQETDIDAIQTWLASEGAEHAGQSYYADNGFPEELPECLVKLHPVYIKFSNSDSQDRPSIEIVWPFAMEECGLIVGSPSMETPKKGCLKIRKDYYEYRRPVKPGAYVFTRG